MVKNLEISIKNDDGIDTKVQVRDFLNSEDYFKFLALQPIERPSDVNSEDPDFKILIDSQAAQYHLILAMVINPKLDEQKVRKMHYLIQQELFNVVQQFCFPTEETEEGEPDKLDHFPSAGEPQDGS